MDKIRVLIVDDHSIVRQGLQSLLSSHADIQVVGEADNGPAALKQMAGLRPDIVLLDLRLPGVGGVEIAHQLRQTHPQTRIIVLTAYDDEEYLLGALREGVHGYLLKDVSVEGLAAAIRAVHRGEHLLDPSMEKKVLQQFQALARSKALQESGLTEQELNVLRQIAQGATNREIGASLYLSEGTVKRVIQDMLTKLEVTNRTQAVVEGMKRGLI